LQQVDLAEDRSGSGLHTRGRSPARQKSLNFQTESRQRSELAFRAKNCRIQYGSDAPPQRPATQPTPPPRPSVTLALLQLGVLASVGWLVYRAWVHGIADAFVMGVLLAA
jgi:hypothetical protein